MDETESDPMAILNSLIGGRVSEEQRTRLNEMRVSQSNFVISEGLEAEGLMEDDEDSEKRLEEAEAQEDEEQEMEEDLEEDNSLIRDPRASASQSGTASPSATASSSSLDRDALTRAFRSEDLVKFVQGTIGFSQLTEHLERALHDEESAEGPSLEEEEEAEEEEDEEQQKRDFETELASAAKRSRRGAKRLKIDHPIPGPSYEAAPETPKKSTETGIRVRRNKLPAALSGLMGEANICFVRGEVDDAIRMCHEVIKEYSLAPEPFATLGMIHEEQGDIQKAFQNYLIACFLNPTDCEGWIKVADMATELKDFRRAIMCFTKAISLKPDNMRDLQWERIRLYEKTKEWKRALDSCDAIMKSLGPEDGEWGMKVAKQMAGIHYEQHTPQCSLKEGIAIMKDAFERFKDHITSESVNAYLELLLADSQYIECLKIFYQYCGVGYEGIEPIIKDQLAASDLPDDAAFIDDGSSLHILPIDLVEKEVNKSQLRVRLDYEEDFPVDLRSKLIVTLIRLKCLSSVKDLSYAILKEPPDDMGDLYLEIAEAYMHIKMYQEAKAILHTLVTSSRYAQSGEVWLLYGICLKELEETELAIDAYLYILGLLPNHVEARVTLAQLLIKSDRKKEALEYSLQPATVYQTDLGLAEEPTERPSLPTYDIDLLLIRCRLLYEYEMWPEFVEDCHILLLSDMMYLSDPKDLQSMITSTTHATRMVSLRREKNASSSSGNRSSIAHLYSERPNFTGRDLSGKEVVEMWTKMISALLYHRKDTVKLRNWTFSLYTSTALGAAGLYDPTIDYYAVLALYHAKDQYYLYPLLKAVLFREPGLNAPWNLLSSVMMHFFQDLRHNRFCIRLFTRNQDSLPLAYFNGHNALLSGSYRHALAEYMLIHKNNPRDPYAAFCCMLGYLHLACQKFTSNRNNVVLQMQAFAQVYLELRGEGQESLYNLGRMFHGLNLLHLALHFYRRALDAGPPKPSQASAPKPSSSKRQPSSSSSYQEQDQKQLLQLSLEREIAFNLIHIYKQSGAHDLALSTARKYMTI